MDKLYLGSDSGRGKDSMRARFKAQRAADLYGLLERTIRLQFVWDAAAKKLRPKDPKLQSFNDPYAQAGVTSMLRQAERALHRDKTFMQ